MVHWLSLYTGIILYLGTSARKWRYVFRPSPLGWDLGLGLGLSEFRCSSLVVDIHRYLGTRVEKTYFMH